MTAVFRQLSAVLSVEIAGNPLAVDVEPLLVRSYVDDHLGMPDTFFLEFRDEAHDVLGKIGATIGATVTLTAVSGDDPAGTELLSGEITALETDHDANGSRSYVRGYDTSHRLLRGRTTEAWKNVTVSDVVHKVADRAGFTEGSVDATSTVLDHLGQPNVSDWEQLARLAVDVGYDVRVQDGKLDFTEPQEADEGPDVGDVDSRDPLQLTAGTNLLRFRAAVSSSEQVSEVHVRSWDYRQKQALDGVAPVATRIAQIGTSPAQLANTFGAATLTEVTTPYSSQAEVDTAAKALAERTGARFVTLSGVALGSPDLRAGAQVSLGLVGEPFEGKYVLTTTTHRFDSDEGYTTAFTVGAGGEESMLGMTGGGSGGARQASSGVGQFDGVVPALVTDVRDPDDMGRVKLKFPWLSDTYESDWSRVTQMGAGADRGAVWLPEVNDEVLVAFEHGDIRRPYIIGSLYNGSDKPRLGDSLVDGSTGAVQRRGLISRKGSALVFLDGDDNEGICLLSSDKSLKIALNQTGTTIKISSDGSVQIEGSQDVSIKAGTSLSLEGQTSVSIKSGATLELSGADVKMTGTGPVQIQGATLMLN